MRAWEHPPRLTARRSCYFIANFSFLLFLVTFYCPKERFETFVRERKGVEMSAGAKSAAHQADPDGTSSRDKKQESVQDGVYGPPGSAADTPRPAGPEIEPRSSAADVTRMWIQFAKTFAVIFPIYVLGYFAFSFSWVLIGLALFFWWRRNKGNKNGRLNRALAFLEQEEQSVRQGLPASELPPWVRTWHLQIRLLLLPTFMRHRANEKHKDLHLNYL